MLYTAHDRSAYTHLRRRSSAAGLCLCQGPPSHTLGDQWHGTLCCTAGCTCTFTSPLLTGMLRVQWTCTSLPCCDPDSRHSAAARSTTVWESGAVAAAGGGGVNSIGVAAGELDLLLQVLLPALAALRTPLLLSMPRLPELLLDTMTSGTSARLGSLEGSDFCVRATGHSASACPRLSPTCCCCFRCLSLLTRTAAARKIRMGPVKAITAKPMMLALMAMRLLLLLGNGGSVELHFGGKGAENP